MAKEKKKRGCFGCLSWIVIIVVGFLVLGFIASMFSDDDSNRDDNERNEEIAEEQESEDIVEEDEELVEEVEENEVVLDDDTEESSEEEIEENNIENIEDHLNSIEYVISFEQITEPYTTGPLSDLTEFEVTDSKQYRVEIESHIGFFSSNTNEYIQEVIQDLANSHLEYDYIVFELFEMDSDDEPYLRNQYFRLSSDALMEVVKEEDDDEMLDKIRVESDFFFDGIEADYGFGTVDVPKSAEEQLLEDFNHEVIDGVDYYTIYKSIIWSPNGIMRDFSMDSADLLKIVNGDIENGVVFRLATDLMDGYGNESKEIVVNVWYSQETLNRINYDNWPIYDATGLYDTADGVIIHYAINQDVDQNNKLAGDNAPNHYRDSIGAEYEE